MDKELKRIADALERIANRYEGLVDDSPEPDVVSNTVAKTKKEETPKTETPNLDAVVKALQSCMEKEGRDAAVELLGKYGAKRASDIAEDKRASFIKDAS